MPQGAAVQKMFAGIAGRYDVANHLLSGGVDFLWRAKLVRMVRACQPRKVLDLATGSGDVALALWKGLPPSVTVTGMDFCEPMLEQARRKAAQRNAAGDGSTPKPGRAPEFVFGDGLALPVPDNSVDAVTIAFGVRNYEDRPRGMREMLRVLRPGGTAFCLEFSQPMAIVRPLYYLYLKLVLPGIAAIVTGDRKAYDYLAGSIEQFPTRDELSAQFYSAGFTTVSATPLTFGVVAIHAARKHP